METKHCLKCGFSWIPRKENPVACPQCKNRKWSIQRNEVDVYEGNSVIKN